MLAKVILRPLFPGLLLSRAYVTYRCVDAYRWRQVDIVWSSLLSVVYICVVILVDFADFMRFRFH